MIMFSRLTLCWTLIVVLNSGNLWAQQAIDEFDPCLALRDAALFKPLRDIDARMPSDGKRLPPDCSGPYFQSSATGDERRFDSITSLHWKPTNFFHMPAYFDDVPLERYGQTQHPRLQPVLSGVKFALALPILPYKMGVDRPHDCVTTLGHLPPGDCLPCIKQTLPLEFDAAFFEAATAVGLVFLLP